MSEATASSRLCAMHLSPDPKTAAAAQGRNHWRPVPAQDGRKAPCAWKLRLTVKVFLRHSPNSLVLIILSMGVLPACLYILHVHARCLWRPEKAPDHTECCVLLCGFLDLNPQVRHWVTSSAYF